MSEWRFRGAELADAEAFSKWAATNPDIEQKDLVSALKDNNPTVLFFVVEKDGVPVVFAPFYLQMLMAYMGLNPESSGKDKLKAMQFLIESMAKFATEFGINEIVTMSRAEYPVAQWAVKHGFDLEPKQAFNLDLRKVLKSAKV